MTLDFVHLHVHTEYSLLDGALRIRDLVKRAKELDMPAVAMTDHGVLYGMLDFYRQAKKAGIKPIIGCEVYLAPGSRFDRKGQERYHLVLLAVNKEGYRNLNKLVSKAWLEGFYYKPRVDKELLFEHHQGLVALSACLQGEIPQLLLKNRVEEAKKAARDYEAIFGKGNFFLEIQDHQLLAEKQVNSHLIQLGRSLEIPLVVSNDVHYLNQKDAELHELFLALQTGKTIKDTDRMTFPNDSFYFKTPEEMQQLFPQLPEAYTNTLEIAERSELDFDFNSFYLPAYPDLPEGKNPADLLREKCLLGLQEKGLSGKREAEERLEYELKIIEEMGYVSYFLIVWDFVDYARRQGIRVGPGRGSAAGSLVAYLLGITRINPLEYNLIFERFLNPERVTMPDIDIDFDERRDEIIAYVIQRYGREKVAQIGTFGTMAARAAIRDVGRVLDIPLSKVDRIAKLVPGRPGITLQEALQNNERLARYYREDKEVKKLLDYAQGIEGFPRHISTHAAGVIIGPTDLSEIIPLQNQDNSIITQLPMNDLEALGLLKMDFLGLRNLTIIGKTLDLIRERHGLELDIDNLPLDDPEVYQLLQQGKTLGVFQMESHLFQDLNQRLKPDRFTDLIALLALGRPGPLGSNLVDQYIDSRHGKRKAKYLHPSLEPILAETFGLILYQEQVMEIASKLAGYTLGEADLLRRGMGKKKKELIARERERFVQGAGERGIEAKTAHEIFDQMEYFAGYGFNKSHSAAYALLAYQTAYLKVKYPAEFMAALLSTVMNNLDKVALYIRECREMGLEVLPPDINQSTYDFIPIQDKKILFGLKAVKNVGDSAIEAIVEERKSNGPYLSLEDFVSRVDLRRVNVQVVESLIKAGAFASFPQHRSQLLLKYEELYEKAGLGRKERSRGQSSFFDLLGADAGQEFFQNQLSYPDVPELPLEERIAQEKEYLGIYLTAHPLDDYQLKIKVFTNSHSQQLKPVNNLLTIAGMIVEKKEHITKQNKPMAFLTLEDWLGKIDLIVFPDVYQENRQYLEVGQSLLVIGRLDEEKIIVKQLLPLDHKFLVVEIAEKDLAKLFSLKKFSQRYRGELPFFLKIKEKDKEYLLLLNRRYWVNGNAEFNQGLADIVGEKGYRYY